MGPQLYRCGNDANGMNLIWFGLNVLQWGRNFIVAEISQEKNYQEAQTLLQWGRNFIVAEIHTASYAKIALLNRFNGAATLSLRKYPVSLGPVRATCRASMGPQLYRCGNYFEIGSYHIQYDASMGPQLYRCGNTKKSGLYR